MRIFHVNAEQFCEIDALPQDLPGEGYLWVGIARRVFEDRIGEMQAALQRWIGGSSATCTCRTC